MMFDELRHAQLYGRLALAFGEHHDGFDDPGRSWMEGLQFQLTRRIVEEIMATLDWGKAILMADIVFEPLHTAAAHALLTSGALAAGDSLTPFVCRSIEDDKIRHRESAAAFLQLLSGDQRHGEHNRELISGWIADELPRAYAAAVALLGATAVDTDAVTEALTWVQTQLTEADIAARVLVSPTEEIPA
jgi:propane 2-monooxygenase small subunit